MRKSPHRIGSALLVATALLLAACGGSSDDDNSTTDAAASEAESNETSSSSEEPTTTSLETLQFVNPLPDNDVWGQIADCMEEQAAEYGLEFTESGPSAAAPSDPVVMIQQVEDAVAIGQDAVVTFPSSGAFGPVLQRAQEQGVITGAFYGDGTPESGATVTAGVDWNTIGAKYVAAIAELPGDHVVGLVAEAPTGVGGSWIAGMENAAATFDNVTLAETVFIGGDASNALPEVTNLLTANPDITIVASNTGLMTQGGATAIRDKGLEGEVHLLAINNANGGPEAINDGIAIGLYLQDLCDLSKRMVDGVVAASEGETVPLIEVNDVIATQQNVQEFIDMGWN